MTQTAKQKPLIPAYLIVGEDALKRSTVLRRLRERLAQYGDLSFNSDTFDGETALGADIVSACNTMPFASEKRLVYVCLLYTSLSSSQEPRVLFLWDANAR